MGPPDFHHPLYPYGKFDPRLFRMPEEPKPQHSYIGLISMAILTHVDADAAERAAYVRQANMVRRGGEQEPDMEQEAEGAETVAISPERYAELSAHEQMVLTISENGYGKRSSAYCRPMDSTWRSSIRRDGA